MAGIAHGRTPRQRKSSLRAGTHESGLLDTSVVITSEVDALPDYCAISVATLAELHYGVNVATNDDARKLRLRRLTEVEATFDPLPIDDAVGRFYGSLAHSVRVAVKRPRTRVIDVFIAATALANELPLYTKNHEGFRVFESLLEVVYV